MQSRLTRGLLVVIAIAIGAAGTFLLKDTDNKMTAQRAAADTLRDRARTLAAILSDVRAGQAAYVAQGQSGAFWMSHVTQLMPNLEQETFEFGAALRAPAAQTAFEPAAAAIENFQKLDNRVQDHVRDGNPLLAADLIFSDGLEATGTARTQINAALAAELKLRQSELAELRANQLTVMEGTAGGVLLVILLLGLTGADGRTRQPDTAEQLRSLMARQPVQPPKPLPPPVKPSNLNTAAALCSDLARVLEPNQLPRLLERTAKIIDASGMIVWTADSTGRELRPVISFGYTDSVMARMRSISRDAANAVAAAYRSSAMRTVNADGTASGALVLPLVTSEGCIGVLSAEMKGGSERDESSQALATIFAAQLATLVAAPAPAQKLAAQA
jgi:hypothetical protein